MLCSRYGCLWFCVIVTFKLVFVFFSRNWYRKLVPTTQFNFGGAFWLYSPSPLLNEYTWFPVALKQFHLYPLVGLNSLLFPFLVFFHSACWTAFLLYLTGPWCAWLLVIGLALRLRYLYLPGLFSLDLWRFICLFQLGRLLCVYMVYHILVLCLVFYILI